MTTPQPSTAAELSSEQTKQLQTAMLARYVMTLNSIKMYHHLQIYKKLRAVNEDFQSLCTCTVSIQNSFTISVLSNWLIARPMFTKLLKNPL